MLCDRNVVSSYVLQRLDGVPLDVAQALNATANLADLAVVLTAEPEIAADRIARRARTAASKPASPFPALKQSSRRRPSIASPSRGYPMLGVDTTHTAVARMAAQLAARITQLATVPRAQLPSA